MSSTSNRLHILTKFRPRNTWITIYHVLRPHTPPLLPRQYYYRHSRAVRVEATRLRANFASLSAWDEATKGQIWKQTRRLAIDYSDTVVFHRGLETALGRAILLVAILSLLGITFSFVPIMLPGAYDFSLARIILILLEVFALTQIRSYAPKLNFQTRLILQVIAAQVYVVLALALVQYFAPHFEITALVTLLDAAFTVAVMMPLIVLTILITDILSMPIRRALEHRRPEATIAVSLLLILYKLEKKGEKWNRLRYRSELSHALESVAAEIEFGLPSILSSGDAASDSSLKITALKLATTVRSLKSGLLMSRATTKSEFQEQIVAFFTNVASGCWGDIALTEPTALTRQAVYLVFSKALMSLLVGIIPLAAMWLFRQQVQFQNQTVQGLSDVVLLGCILWFVLTLVELIDPSYKERLVALTSLKNLISGP